MRFCILFFLLGQFADTAAQPLVPQTVRYQNGRTAVFQLLKGYGIAVAAEGFKRPRFFSRSPDGRLFLTDMHDRSDNHRGRIMVLENWSPAEKKFRQIRTYMSGLHNPNQVAFYRVGSQWRIYVAETGQLRYFSYRSGDSIPSGKPVTIARFPATGLNYKYGGWHLTRSISFRQNKLYVSVGSSCNACMEKNNIQATIVEMDPEGRGFRTYANGLRNSVGMKWIGNELWVTSMGRDGIGPDKPEDLFHTVKEGGFYGWPFYFQFRGKIQADPAFRDSMPAGFNRKPPVAPWGFAAHSAPLGFTRLENFGDSTLNNSFLVALHGSTSVWRQRGNSIVQLLPGGRQRTIVSGFLKGKTEAERIGRPCDVFQWDENSFFISDDKNGVIYYVWKVQTNAK